MNCFCIGWFVILELSCTIQKRGSLTNWVGFAGSDFGKSISDHFFCKFFFRKKRRTATFSFACAQTKISILNFSFQFSIAYFFIWRRGSVINLLSFQPISSWREVQLCKSLAAWMLMLFIIFNFLLSSCGGYFFLWTSHESISCNL